MKLTYRGAMGDIFHEMFMHNSYGLLETLSAENRATVEISTWNPGVKDMFDFHRNRKFIDLIETPEKIYEHTDIWQEESPVNKGCPVFYPSQQDWGILSRLANVDFVVFSGGAGLPNRSIPEKVLDDLVSYCLEYHDASWQIVTIGKSYHPPGNCTRIEPAYKCNWRINHLVDKLSMAGAAWLLQKSRYHVTSISASCILGWYLGKHQLVVHPDEILEEWNYCPIFSGRVDISRHLKVPFSRCIREIYHKFMAGYLRAKCT